MSVSPMDRLLRFNDYEVFAHVASGFAAMLVVDFVFGSRLVLGAQWSVSEGIALVFAAYLVGHVTAGPAAWLLERLFVRRLLGAPSKALFCEAPTGALAGIKRQLFRDYFIPLEKGIQECVKAKVREEGPAESSGESLFWVAFVRAKRDPLTYGRMEAFMKLYGFCRNIAFVGLVAAVLLIGNAIWLVPHAAAAGDILDRLWWALFALIVSLAMLYRYLKFHRLYSVEVFTGYLELPPLKGRLNDAN